MTCSGPGSWGLPQCCGSRPAGCCVCWCEPELAPGAPHTRLCSGRSCWSGRQSSDQDEASALTPASFCTLDTLYFCTNENDELLISEWHITISCCENRSLWKCNNGLLQIYISGIFNYIMFPFSSVVYRSYVVQPDHLYIIYILCLSRTLTYNPNTCKLL